MNPILWPLCSVCSPFCVFCCIVTMWKCLIVNRHNIMWYYIILCDRPVLRAGWFPAWRCAGPRRVRLLQSSEGRCDAAGSALARGAWSAAHMTAAMMTASETTALSPATQNQTFRPLMPIAYCNNYRSALVRVSSSHQSYFIFILLQTHFKHYIHSCWHRCKVTWK